MTIFLVLVSVALILHSVHGLGCMHQVCEGNKDNELRPCPDQDSTCGTYGGKRFGERLVKGVDIKCEPNSKIYAPFSGQMYFWRPHGGRKEEQCADKGVRIEGEGQWQGYFALIAYVEPEAFGGRVEKGDVIGKQVDVRCVPNRSGNFVSFIQLQLYIQVKHVNPTYHLRECLCTGQICESNTKNMLIGLPFKSDSRFNGVKGWEIQCPDVKGWEAENGNMLDPDETEPRAPMINSPIEGSMLGRIRVDHDDKENNYKGCDNDGLLVVGTGKWADFTVRIYNARFIQGSPGLGEMRIAQGQPIGTRLNCPGQTHDSIFMEIRRNGKLVNVTDAILANNCQLPTFD